MPTQIGPIFFLTGTPGAGKSTVAKALAQRYPLGVHIEVDQVRKMVASGLADLKPGPPTPERIAQIHLAHQAAGVLAKTYSEAGYAVVAEHASHVPYIESFLAEARTATVVALIPNLTVNQNRNLLRSQSGVNFLSLKPVIEMLHESMPIEFGEVQIPVINTTVLTVEETVDQILEMHG